MHEATTTNPRAILKPTRQPRLYTLEEYLRREERATALHEYYDGEIVKLPTARGPHNIIAVNITTALKIAIKTTSQKLYRLRQSTTSLSARTQFGIISRCTGYL